jgi:hypothetical protein
VREAAVTHRVVDSDSRREIQSTQGGFSMIRRMFLAMLCAVGVAAVMDASASDANAQNAYGRAWGRTYRTQDWNRFYHYPYVYYPQNYYGNEYYRSAEDLYYRYPNEMRIPVYNKQWHNEYPENRLYHRGSHFILDVF